jgi:outer membrane protein TolC
MPGHGERFNGVVAGVSIPMFGNRNNVKRARAQAAFAESQYRSGMVDTYSNIAELYARTALLGASIDDYRRITENTRSAELLYKAIEAGQISVVEYFAQLAPIYQAELKMTEVERDYRLACAQIMSIEL